MQCLNVHFCMVTQSVSRASQQTGVTGGHSLWPSLWNLSQLLLESPAPTCRTVSNQHWRLSSFNEWTSCIETAHISCTSEELFWRGYSKDINILSITRSLFRTGKILLFSLFFAWKLTFNIKCGGRLGTYTVLLKMTPIMPAANNSNATTNSSMQYCQHNNTHSGFITITNEWYESIIMTPIMTEKGWTMKCWGTLTKTWINVISDLQHCPSWEPGTWLQLPRYPDPVSISK